MKKFFAGITAFAMALSLATCGATSPTESAQSLAGIRLETLTPANDADSNTESETRQEMTDYNFFAFHKC